MAGMSADIYKIKRDVRKHTDSLDRIRVEIRMMVTLRRLGRLWFSFGWLLGLCFTDCSVANYGDEAELLFAKRHPIDSLIEAKIPVGVQLAPRADRLTLLRRASFGLVGLPPTPDEIDAFVSDAANDQDAFIKVVERLLS